MDEKEKLLENNMDDDELELLTRLEPVDPRTLTPQILHRMAETVRMTGAELNMSGLTPDEYYDHGAEMPKETKAED